MSGSSSRPWVFGVLLVAAFAWGLATSRFGVFPAAWIERLSTRGVEGGAGVAPATPEESAAERRTGLWHIARSSAEEGGAPDREAVEALADLPYMSGYELAPEDQRVTTYDADRAWTGLNLVVSGHAPEVYLMDMEGRVLHRWRRELADVWPAMAREQDLGGFETFFRRAHLLPDGGLLAIYDGLGLVELDRDSNVLWAHPGGEHHDLFVDDRGRIHTLTRRTRDEHPGLDLEGPIEEDFITVLDADGTVLSELSVLDCFLDSDYASILATARREGDILHTNTIERMDGRFAARHRLYNEGNYLISVPRLNTIAVIDPDSRSVVWALAGLWRFQHQPTVLDNGDMLVFDNTGNGGDSKVVEIDPLSQRIVWDYRGTPERRFTSYFLGSSQRLPNGNTLITESTAGRAFEVTGAGEIVWEYVNPHRAGEEGELIASLLEVVRVDPRSLDRNFDSVIEAAREASR